MDASWVEIDTGLIRDNLRAAQHYLEPGARFCAVLKADAYGHGISVVLPELMKEGVDFIGITSNDEARSARSCGYIGRIIRLRAAHISEAKAVLSCQVEELVGSTESARSLSALGRQSGKRTPVHLILNVNGMGREGIELSQEAGRQSCLEILRNTGLQIVGMMTHFPSNTSDDLAESRTQFLAQVNWIFENSNLVRDQVIVHAGSSLTLMAGATAGFDMVRCGAVLYGIVGPRDRFKSTLMLKSGVTEISSYQKHSTVGYDRSYRLERDSRLANVSIGYANGYRRVFAGHGVALISGKRLPVLGKISMNSLVVDVTDLPETQIGDTVVLFGSQAGACVDIAEVEAQSQTILADLYVDWGRSNARKIG